MGGRELLVERWRWRLKRNSMGSGGVREWVGLGEWQVGDWALAENIDCLRGREKTRLGLQSSSTFNQSCKILYYPILYKVSVWNSQGKKHIGVYSLWCYTPNADQRFTWHHITLLLTTISNIILKHAFAQIIMKWLLLSFILIFTSPIFTFQSYLTNQLDSQFLNAIFLMYISSEQ